MATVGKEGEADYLTDIEGSAVSGWSGLSS